MAQKKFKLTLPSKSSMSTYPNNSASRYSTKLCRPITLDGDWEAALMELQFPGRWINLASPECFLVWLLPHENSVKNKIANCPEFVLNEFKFYNNVSKEDATYLHSTK